MSQMPRSWLSMLPMHDGIGNHSTAGDVSSAVIIPLGFALRAESRSAFVLDHRPALVGGALHALLVERIALALERGHRRGIGVTGPQIEALSILARQVRVKKAEISVQALVDRRGSTAGGSEQYPQDQA